MYNNYNPYIFVDIKIDNNIYHMGKLKVYEAKQLAYDLNMEFELITREKIQSEYEELRGKEKQMIMIAQIKKKTNSLFDIQQEGTETQKTTD